MCMFNLYKRAGSIGPLLTFQLTMVVTTSHSMIPLADTHWVASSLNTFAVKLLLPVDQPPVEPGPLP